MQICIFNSIIHSSKIMFLFYSQWQVLSIFLFFKHLIFFLHISLHTKLTNHKNTSNYKGSKSTKKNECNLPPA